MPRTLSATLVLIAALGFGVPTNAQIADPPEAVSSPDGVPISYEVHGTGTPALVFIHGWSCDRSYWTGQVEPFSREYKVVAVDLADHGESGLGRDAWTIESYGA